MNTLHEELHFHTENSQFDSADSVEKMVKRAKELGVTQMAITEHGVLTSIDTFMSVCKEENIKPVAGVEAYVQFTDAAEEKCHMCLYAKDYIGYQAIGMAVTDSFSNMYRKTPIMNEAILKKYFGKGSKGYGHVITSSACISGIICKIFQTNQVLEKKANKLSDALKKLDYKPADDTPVKELENKIQIITDRINELTPISKRTFKNKEKALQSLNGDDLKAMQSQLEVEKEETKTAVVEISKLKDEKSNLRKKLTQANKIYKKEVEIENKATFTLKELEEIKSKMLSKEEQQKKANDRVNMLTNLFGEGNFYLEIQYHRMPEETVIMPIIAKMAMDHSIPIVATNDAHMAYPGENNVRARQIMRSLRFISSKKAGMLWQEAGVADKELYIKSQEELKEILCEIIPETIVEKAIIGRKELLDQCNLEIPKENHFPKFTSEIPGETSEDCLIRKVKEGIMQKFPAGLSKEYQERVKKELQIMCDMGYADYHLIVQDYVEYARLIGKFDLENLPDGFEKYKFDKKWLKEKSKNLIGIGVGPGRGSAVGSLVCYLLGITNVDPMKYDLFFERFLNPERVSMPDIDIDFPINIREYIFDYVAWKYGSDNVCHIMTKGLQKARKAIDNCSKLLGDRYHGDTTHFSDLASKLKDMIEDDELPQRTAVMEKFPDNQIALRIYDDACLVKDTFVSYGMHAAGVVISDGAPVKSYIPLMKDTKAGLLKTQCDMVQVEECHHLLKMDFLGLRNLNIITDTLRMIEKNHGEKIDIFSIPFEKEVFHSIYASGFTNSVFQVESQGMKQTMRRANPQNISDIIILVSMYRPGPMDFLDDLIEVMNGKKKASYLIPQLKPILEETYGSIVYQEQVMQIFQQLAEYSLGGADLVRRAMSKKKADKLAKEEKAFIYGDAKRGIKGCIGNGISEKDAKTIFDQMTDFAKYAFNKSHATAYSIVSYQTAWLKYHYPHEYIAVCFSYSEKEKRKGLLDDCNMLHIAFKNPDINKSEVNFSVKDGSIYFGLKDIQKVATKSKIIIDERNQHGEYKSLADFVYRTGIRRDCLKNLINAGAFDHIMSCSRKAMIEQADLFDDLIKTVQDKKKILKEENLTAKRKENALKALNNLKDTLESSYISDEKDDIVEKLLNEKEAIGLMLSGHISDNYGSEKDNNCMKLSEVVPCKVGSVMGVISDLRIVNRKADGKRMAFFTLDMPDGDINVCCFAKEYEQFSNIIAENNVLKITGEISEKVDEFQSNKEEGEIVKIMQIIVKKAVKLNPIKNKIVVYGNEKDKNSWQEFRNRLSEYEREDGYPLILFNMQINRFQNTQLFVSKEILHSNYFNAEMM